MAAKVGDAKDTKKHVRDDSISASFVKGRPTLAVTQRVVVPSHWQEKWSGDELEPGMVLLVWGLFYQSAVFMKDQ